MRKIPGVSIHWHAMYRKQTDLYAGQELVDLFRAEHKKRGWRDIGYHYVIHHEGHSIYDQWKVYDGRPDSWVGAHSYTTFGNQHIGICVAYAMDDKEVPKGAIEQLVKLIADLNKAYNFGISEKTIHGHRYFVATECPGNKMMSILPQIIKSAKNLKKHEPLPKGQDTKRKQPEEEQLSKIKLNLGNDIVTGVRLNNQAYIHVTDLRKLGLSVNYDKLSDTVIIRGDK